MRHACHVMWGGGAGRARGRASSIIGVPARQRKAKRRSAEKSVGAHGEDTLQERFVVCVCARGREGGGSRNAELRSCRCITAKYSRVIGFGRIASGSLSLSSREVSHVRPGGVRCCDVACSLCRRDPTLCCCCLVESLSQALASPYLCPSSRHRLCRRSWTQRPQRRPSCTWASRRPTCRSGRWR